MLGTDTPTIGDLLETMKPAGTQFVVVNHFDEAAYGPFNTFDEAFKWAMDQPNMNTTPIPLYPR